MIRTVNNKRTDECRSFYSNLILFELSDLKCWVAGGAIRAFYAKEPINDIDLYFTSKTNRKAAERYLLGKDDAKIVFENKNVTKIFYNNRIFDFCKKYYKTPKNCIKSFDFTVVQAAVDITNSYVDDCFFIDLCARKLRLATVPAPFSSLSRLQKYIRKGYSMDKKDLVGLTKTLQKIQINENTGEAKNYDSDTTFGVPASHALTITKHC